MKIPTKKKGTFRSDKSLGGLFDQSLGLEDSAEPAWDRFERIHDGQAIRERELSEPAEVIASRRRTVT